jgi:nucleoside-diphosphate-sugar epimerase
LKVFITGATGFIGGSVARKLAESGFQVRGLVRSEARAGVLKEMGIDPVIGVLSDTDLLTREATIADAVINAADADDLTTARTFILALKSTGKTLIHTSGSSIVADEAMGEPNDTVHTKIPDNPVPGKAARVAIDHEVLASASQGVRSMVICPTMIYGLGQGPAKQSQQVPMLLRHAKEAGVSHHVGRGLNRWSHVHVDDVANLYLIALHKAEPGGFFFAENGEATLLEIARDIARRLGIAGPEPLTFEQAVAVWGRSAALYGLGSNSRVRSDRAREDLGWAPKHSSIFHDLPREAAQYRNNDARTSGP